MAKIWSTTFHELSSHTLLKFDDDDESYGHPCTRCSSAKTRVVSKASRRGYLIKCQDCKNLYYVQEKKS